MANRYIPKLQKVIDSLAPNTPEKLTIEIKPFFGGAACYVNGKICTTYTKAGLAIKLPEEDRLKLFAAKKAIPARYFPKAPIKKQYAMLPTKNIRTSKSLLTLLQKSIEYIRSNKK